MSKPNVLTAVTYAKVGRDAGSGRYITVAEAKRRPRQTVVEKIRMPRRPKKLSSKQ